MNIRYMTEQDVIPAVKLEEENFPDPWTRQMFSNAAADEHSVFLVAEELGALIGLVGIEVVAGEGYVDNVSVSRRHLKKGVATALLTEAMRIARQEKGATAFTLEVRRSNTPARSLYEKMGFVCEGARPDYYTEPKEDAMIYWMRETHD